MSSFNSSIIEAHPRVGGEDMAKIQLVMTALRLTPA